MSTEAKSEFWMSNDTGKNKFIFPVLPEKITFNRDSDNVTVNILLKKSPSETFALDAYYTEGWNCSIAEQSGVKMPSFFGYMAYSVCILVPIFLAMTYIFL